MSHVFLRGCENTDIRTDHRIAYPTCARVVRREGAKKSERLFVLPFRVVPTARLDPVHDFLHRQRGVVRAEQLLQHRQGA